MALFTIMVASVSCERMTIVVTDIPDNTPVASSIYITGNFNYWDPGDKRFQMLPLKDSLYYIDLPRAFGMVEFRFTRGDWTAVEGDNCGYPVENRVHEYSNPDTVYVSIASWKDLGPTDCQKMTILVGSIPENTPPADQIYLVGNINHWDMDDKSYPLKKVSDSSYYITIPKFEEMLECKFTRGNYATVEVNPHGDPIPIRKFTFGMEDTVEVAIPAWEDLVQTELQQVTFVIDSLPPGTPDFDNIYLVGNMNEWYPWDREMIFNRPRDGKPYLTLTVENPLLKFKVTRGGWKRREVDHQFNDITDRSHIYQNNDTVLITVANWMDFRDKKFVESEYLTVFVENMPEKTAGEDPVYIVGDFNGWKYRDPRYRLQKNPDGTRFIQLPKKIGEFNYRFSRGGPALIEVNEVGRVVNRKTRITNIDTLFISIPYWLDRLPDDLTYVTFIIKKLPETTPNRDDIYIAGNFNGWDPGNIDYILKTNDNGLLEVSIPRKLNNTYYNAMEFKFTRGNWETVETKATGFDIPNRVYLFGKENVVEIAIEGWHDLNR